MENLGIRKSGGIYAQSVRVLVADDDECVRDMVGGTIESVCEKSGLAVDLCDAEDGRQMVHHVTQGGIDLVVSDVLMPGGDGPEAVRSFINSPTAPYVAMMSGYVQPDQYPVLAELFKSQNFLGVFPKPLNEGDLELLLALASVHVSTTECARLATHGSTAECERLATTVSFDPLEIRRRILSSARLACYKRGVAPLLYDHLVTPAGIEPAS